MKRKVNISLEADQSAFFTVCKTHLGGKHLETVRGE